MTKTTVKEILIDQSSRIGKIRSRIEVRERAFKALEERYMRREVNPEFGVKKREPLGVETIRRTVAEFLDTSEIDQVVTSEHPLDVLRTRRKTHRRLDRAESLLSLELDDGRAAKLSEIVEKIIINIEEQLGR